MLYISGLVLTRLDRLPGRVVKIDEDTFNNVIQEPAEANQRNLTHVHGTRRLSTAQIPITYILMLLLKRPHPLDGALVRGEGSCVGLLAEPPHPKPMFHTRAAKKGKGLRQQRRFAPGIMD